MSFRQDTGREKNKARHQTACIFIYGYGAGHGYFYDKAGGYANGGQRNPF